jgi:hypothetical protein
MESGGLIWIICFAAALHGGQLTTSQVTGKVVDRISGAAIPSAQVRLILRGSGEEVAESSSAETGSFTFRGIAAGAYLVSAGKSGYAAVVPADASLPVTVTSAGSSPLTLRLIQTAVVTGSIFDASGQVLRGIRVAPVARRTVNGVPRLLLAAKPVESDDRGSYRIYGLPPGIYSIALLPGSESARDLVPATVYLPGTSDPEDAKFLDLAAGECRSGTDLTMPPLSSAKVHGRVTNIPADWRPGQTAVTILFTAGLPLEQQTIQVSDGGEFDFARVPPGAYRVVAWGPAIGMGAPVPSPGQHAQQGSRLIQVESTGPNEIEVPLRENVAISGLVRFAPGADTIPNCFAGARLTLHPADPMPSVRPLQASLDTSGRFDIPAVPAGTYSIELRGLTRDCFLTDAAEGQRKPHKGMVSLEGETNLVLFLGTQAGQVSGTVVDAGDRPVPGAEVQMVPTGLPAPGVDDVLTTASKEDGRFVLEGVPPGSYQLLADTQIASTAYMDPSFRKDHAALELEVKSNQHAQVVLRILR